MSTQRQQGFTLIELLVIAVIVGILATIVVMAHSGVLAKNRNATRQSDVNTLQNQLEAYYTDNSKYPSITELNDSSWRHAHLKELPDGAVSDPQWSTKIAACTNANQPIFAGNPTPKCYSYQATTAEGVACDDSSQLCAEYTLTALFEGGEKYVKTSLN